MKANLKAALIPWLFLPVIACVFAAMVAIIAFSANHRWVFPLALIVLVLGITTFCSYIGYTTAEKEEQ